MAACRILEKSVPVTDRFTVKPEHAANKMVAPRGEEMDGKDLQA